MVIGLGLLAGGVYWTYSMKRFIANSVSTTGTVLRYNEHEDDDGTTYHPVVQFATDRGEEITFESSTGSSFRPYREGQEIKVRYDPAKPRHAEINTVMDLWFGPVLLIVLGAFFDFFAVLGLVVLRRRRPQAA